MSWRGWEDAPSSSGGWLGWWASAQAGRATRVTWAPDTILIVISWRGESLLLTNYLILPESWDDWVGEPLGAHLVQPPAHSRANVRGRSGCPGTCPDEFLKSWKMEISQSLWTTCSSPETLSWWRFFLYVWLEVPLLQLVNDAACPQRSLLWSAIWSSYSFSSNTLMILLSHSSVTSALLIFYLAA